MHSKTPWMMNGNTVMSVGAEDVHTIARFETPALATQCVAEHNALAGWNPEALAGLVAAVEHFLDMNEMCDAGWQDLFDALKALEGE